MDNKHDKETRLVMFAEGIEYPITAIATLVAAAVTGAVPCVKVGNGETPEIRFNGRRRR